MRTARRRLGSGSIRKSRRVGNATSTTVRDADSPYVVLHSAPCSVSQLGCRNEQLAFGASDHGKPYAVVQGVVDPVSFNVSHSGAHGLIAVAAAGRLGVDVEERRTPRDLDGLISSVMGPDEQAELALVRGCRKFALVLQFLDH